MRSKQSEPATIVLHRWVGKVVFTIGAAATAGLLLAIFLITDDKGDNYAHVLANHSLTQQNLVPTLWVFGMALVLIACATIWLIALYGSFRIAGPLFRFSQNLKAIIDDAFAIPLAIRQSDLLQREWRQFDSSQARLRQHYTDLHQALAACEQALAKLPEVERPAGLGSEPKSVGLPWPDRRPSPELGSDPNSALQQALATLQEVERRVQL